MLQAKLPGKSSNPGHHCILTGKNASVLQRGREEKETRAVTGFFSIAEESY